MPTNIDNASQMINDAHADLRQYLEKKDLNNVFVSIIEAILTRKPDNPIEFIVHFLKNHYPNETKGAFSEKKLENSGKCLDTIGCNELSQDCDSYSSDSEESQVCDIKKVGPQLARRRVSISAEKLQPSTMVDTDLKGTPKTADEAARINCILETNILFRHLDDSQKLKVQEAMFSVVKADNEVIIKQGDAGDNFYIIEVGHVVVYIETEDQPLKQVATYSVGDSFGELAIMYNAPRAATCVARGEVRLWALDRVSYKMILMETTMAKRIEYKIFLEQVPALEQLTEYEVLTIADALLEENFNDGDIVCNEGDQGDRFYFIRAGVAVCTEKTTDGSTKEVARLSSGSYFGEVALLSSKARQATVTASGELKCVSLDRKMFQRVMGPLQQNLIEHMKCY